MVSIRARCRALLAKLRSELENALEEEHTPKQVAGSFALGVFITSLPTLGVGLLAFVVIAYLFASVSKIALFASVLVLNPVVKWGVYAASFWLGTVLLGPVGEVSRSDISFSAGPDIVVRLVAGNLILAVVFTAIAYVAAYRLTVTYRRRMDEVGLVEEALEDALERLPER